jgi:hypothetical protein
MFKMKKIKLVLLTLVLFTLTSITVSCEKICSGKGTLELTNSSHSTVQKIMINGVSYGTIDPGEVKSIELTPGVYMWQLQGLSGGTGCSAAAVTITECDTQGFKCGG